MTGARVHRSSRRRRSVLGALVGVSAGWVGVAAGQGRLSADASLSGGVATNPYQQAGDTPTAASATLQLTPEYVIESDLTTLRLLGDARITAYSAGYRANDSYSLQGSGNHRVSQTTRLNADVAYVNSVVGTFNDLVVPVGTGLPAGGALPVGDGSLIDRPGILDDPALAGIGQRRSTLSALGGATVTLGRFDEVAARVTATGSRYSGDAGLDEFNSVAGGVSYRRTVSERFTVGINADANRVNYLGGRLGDATIYQPSVSVTRIIDTRWTLTASAGAAVVRLAERQGTRTSTTFNGSLAACRRDTRWNACLTASRASLPSALQGVRTQTGVSATLSYRVTEADDLTLGASYSRADAPLLRSVTGQPIANVGAVDFTSVSAGYAKRFAPRLSAFISASAAKSDDDFINRDANMEARIGVRYRLGERR